MSIKDNLLIGQMLIEQGIIIPEQLEAGLREQKKTNEFICSALVRLGFASEESILSVLSKQLNIPYIKIKEIDISPDVVTKIPAKFVFHYKLMPIKIGGNVLTCAVTDPLNIQIIDDMKLLLGFEIKTVLAGEKDIQESIHKYYGVGAETLEKMVSEKKGQEDITHLSAKTEDLEALTEDASVIKFVNQILFKAVQERATDIHIEPFEDELKVRFRIDGILYATTIPSTIKYFYLAIISRIKIMAQLNIAERRLPQDGRIKVKVGDYELDLRVSIVPTVFGESAQIRILSQQSLLELEKLGLSSEDLKVFDSVIRLPHGIIFVTGPTGSGKTTTLYAALKRINSQELKIITIEDPVEYQLSGITQIQVLPKIGLTFANGLRSVLRHDPDVLMVGEVRDYETAEIAIRSALTGHLVFSTLHTNDAAGAITRLLDMGLEPYLISSSLECLIAQRLVRLICNNCKTKVKPNKQILEELGFQGDIANIELFEGKGCEACKFTGYKGRTAIYEIIRLNDEIRQMILSKSSSQDIKKKAVQQGMKTLLLDGWQKVLQGLTTISEVVRVTQKEALPEDI
ncbi:MAG: ATPase, T2SS/T4P/T4SS family [Candidatus Omnitrophica bacterium]|nr:ATPase, T2SS/T4P/T4SS family [Candidatus Omnitrophota bacterium]MDD5351783.1 ATPase, T2SS/T4P/T4SS family [Candidatus Omnitrophota bacterium]MDD5550609.1 ATPase, T2SS/T4P/T4SS family [Candidatus Omnitrophota bacterium]